MYKNVVKASFKERKNRFIGYVELNDEIAEVHIKNTGRCKELLLPNATVFLSISDNPERKTKYDLIAVEKQISDNKTLLINMDSQAPNCAVKEWLLTGNLFEDGSKIFSEVKKGNSRFDFYAESGNRKTFIEVKGVTLEKDGIALFPDAPTERGVKHINELIECVKEGYEAYIIFVIQMKGIKFFKPNEDMHKEFADTLRNAYRNGVKVLAVDCVIGLNSMKIDSFVPVCLDKANKR